MDKCPRTVVDRVVSLVAVSEHRRLLVVVGVPVSFVVLSELVANNGALALLLAVGLAAVLYTRSTATETIVASALGVGVLLIGLFLLELYWNGVRGSTEPLLGTATRVLWQAVAGIVLLGFGLWLRAVDL
jgi:hypothetical protein